jgi:hypothetical protein
VPKRSEATKYYAYARECLRQAEAADTPDKRDKLIELSRIWVEAALIGERQQLDAGRELLEA